MRRIKDWTMRFMRGRYGYDDLNYTMLAAALLLNLIGLFTRTAFCSTAALILLLLVMIRALSRNTVKRAQENRRFRSAVLVPRRLFKAFMLNRKDKEHRYYLCPGCHQICRVPKGRGEVSVRCPECGQRFERRS